MLNEKQILLKRKELLKQRRTIKRSVAQKPRTFKGIKRKEKNAILLTELNGKISVMDEILKGNKIDFKQLKSSKKYKSILQEIRQIKPLVIHLLKTEPDTRDDDNLLCCRVWENQGVIPNMKMATFKKRYILHQYAMSDSITRCRRALQEKYISLQGKLYAKRHKAESYYNKQYKLALFYGA